MSNIAATLIAVVFTVFVYVFLRRHDEHSGLLMIAYLLMLFMFFGVSGCAGNTTEPSAAEIQDREYRREERKMICREHVARCRAAGGIIVLNRSSISCGDRVGTAMYCPRVAQEIQTRRWRY